MTNLPRRLVISFAVLLTVPAGCSDDDDERLPH
jgi:hypothetical protein